MRRQEIEEIRILLPTGMEVNFADFFETTPLEDLDGDGEVMEYPFNLRGRGHSRFPFLEELARPEINLNYVILTLWLLNLRLVTEIRLRISYL